MQRYGLRGDIALAVAVLPRSHPQGREDHMSWIYPSPGAAFQVPHARLRDVSRRIKPVGGGPPRAYIHPMCLGHEEVDLLGLEAVHPPPGGVAVEFRRGLVDDVPVDEAAHGIAQADGCDGLPP